MKIDDYDTYKVLEPNANRGLVWVTLGLSQSIPTSLHNAVRSLSSITFNQMNRMFLEHQLFDILIYSLVPGQERAPDLPPNPEWLRFLQSDGAVQAVSIILPELFLHTQTS